MERRRKSWERVYSRGLLRYVVFIGISRFGPLFATAHILGRYFAFPFATGWHGFPEELYRFIFDSVLWGICMSIAFWRARKKQYGIPIESRDILTDGKSPL